MKIKKIVFAVLVIMTGFISFAETSVKEDIENFLNRGSYIKIEKKDDVLYYPKSIIARLECNGNL